MEKEDRKLSGSVQYNISCKSKNNFLHSITYVSDVCKKIQRYNIEWYHTNWLYDYLGIWIFSPFSIPLYQITDHCQMSISYKIMILYPWRYDKFCVSITCAKYICPPTFRIMLLCLKLKTVSHFRYEKF